MSEQTKSNVQVIGAGLMGFVAVVGAAGLLYTQLSGRRAAPSAQAGLSAPAASGMTASRPGFAAPASSPAPLIGSAAEDVAAETSAPADSAARAAEVAGRADAEAADAEALRSLEASRHSGRGENTSDARAQVEKTAVAGTKPAPAPAPAAKPVPRIRLDKSGARGSIASSVHYGVTSRSELMGRAAGPVYNFTGRSVAGQPRLAELSGQAHGKLADVEKSIDESTLTAEQKREVKARLKDVREGVAK